MLWVCAILLLTAHAPSVTADELSNTLAQAGFTAAEQSEFTRLFSEAASDGLPTDVLLPRLQEGIAKNVPFDGLLPALEAYVTQLRHARAVLASVQDARAVLHDTASWARAANLLTAGYSEDSLRRIAAACAVKPEAFRPATSLFVSLVEWGLAREAALDLTQAAVLSSVDPGEYADLARILSDASRAREDPDDAAGRIADHLRSGRTIRQIDRILGR